MIVPYSFETLNSGGTSGMKARDFPGKLRNSPPTVLVVDDEALIRWSVVETLGERGYVVREAGDGRMALTALLEASEPYDVVLLDYRLPDSADLRLLQRMRSLAPSSRIIMITAYNSPEVAQEALALGAYSVVSKHFELERLAALL